MRTKGKTTIATLSMAMLLALPAISRADGFERTVPAKNVTSVHVKTFRDVKVESWTKDQIRITGDSGRLSVDVKAGAVQIDSSFDGAELIRVSMPKGIKLTLRTINGDVQVRGLQSKVDITCVNGDVKIDSCSGKVNVETVDGELTVDNASGDLSLKTVSGNLTGTGLKATRLEAKAVSGDIRLSGVTADHVQLTSHSGDVKYSGSVSQNGDLSVKCFSGDMEISLPASQGFEISAKTRSGEVSVEHKLQVSERSNDRVLRRFAKGGVDITLSSFSGDITVKVASQKK